MSQYSNNPFGGQASSMIRNSRAPSRWGFSTLGCPELDLAEATALADRFQMHHMELRALENTLDIAPILQAPRWAPLLEELRLAGRLHMLDSSFFLCAAAEESYNALLRLAAAAERWGIPYLRIFTTPDSRIPTRRELAAAAGWIRRFHRENDFHCRLALETHDGMSSAFRAAAFADSLEEELFFVWDVHHTLSAGESPAESCAALRPDRIVGIHLKDWISTPSEKAVSVLPGTGEAPWGEIRCQLELLPAIPAILEYEKLWEPHLPALSHALDAMRNNWIH